jgi:hypothetical protein
VHTAQLAQPLLVAAARMSMPAMVSWYPTPHGVPQAILKRYLATPADPASSAGLCSAVPVPCNIDGNLNGILMSTE